jgi:hypothetical protein
MFKEGRIAGILDVIKCSHINICSHQISSVATNCYWIVYAGLTMDDLPFSKNTVVTFRSVEIKGCVDSCMVIFNFYVKTVFCWRP